MADLFAAAGEERRRARAPLAERMRPRTLAEVVGQEGALGHGTPLRRMLEEDRLASLILWGPPGSGKTTLARLCASRTGARFVAFSAVTSGIAEIKAVIAAAREDLGMTGNRMVLFVDEIHRFNRAQQDAFLPHVEDGTIVLLGATTENPSFEVNSALLSRCLVVVLGRIPEDDLRAIVRRALADRERGLGALAVRLEPEAESALVRAANGDARVALAVLESAASAAAPGPDGARAVARAGVEAVLQRPAGLYDKSGEEHYNVISALHKSVRGSDPDAALYWLARMLEGGEDPLYVARRVVRMASEDVGLADPRGLVVAVAAYQAVHFLGMPEGDAALAEAVVYLATAPKSNRVCSALGAARRDAREEEALPVPLHIRNAETPLMRKLGYGAGYVYEHDEADHLSGQEFLPENLRGRRYYEPSPHGEEARIRERLEKWAEIRARKRVPDPGGPPASP
ncbi:MAG: replication-associated recombination protein A [Planctomycetales bacterium]|nr:replication-associated recombination protein A [Planctomycetales bacterium]